MQKNTSVTLGTHFDDFLSDQVEKGRYNSVSEAIRDGLRLLEEREIKLAALRHALETGEESGISDYSLTSVIKELDKESAKV